MLDKSSRSDAPRELKDIFECLTVAEAAMEEHPVVNDFLDGMAWTTSAWVREVMCGLGEACFECLPSDLETELRAALTGFQTSVVCERSFNYLRDRTRHCKSGRPGPRRRFHCLATSSLLEDCDRACRYDAPPCVQQASADRSESSAFYQARLNDDCSIPEESLETFMEAGDGMSTGRFLASHLSLSALQSCCGERDQLRTTWMPLLPRRFQVLHKIRRALAPCWSCIPAPGRC